MGGEGACNAPLHFGTHALLPKVNAYISEDTLIHHRWTAPLFNPLWLPPSYLAPSFLKEELGELNVFARPSEGGRGNLTVLFYIHEYERLLRSARNDMGQIITSNGVNLCGSTVIADRSLAMG
jgi:hypothetical protein